MFEVAYKSVMNWGLDAPPADLFPASSIIASVSMKLPAFWSVAAKVWFAQGDTQFTIKHVTWHARGDYFASVAPTGNTQVREEGSRMYCCMEEAAASLLVDQSTTCPSIAGCCCLNCALPLCPPHFRCRRPCWCTSWARA